MPEIQIHQSRPGDIETLSDFEHGYYSQFVWQMNLDLDTETSIAKFRRVRLPRRVFVPYPRNRDEIFKDIDEAEGLLVARLGEEPVGYIKLIGESDAKVARISDLVVPVSMRRKGIASGLLLATMDYCAHRGFRTLLLELQTKNDAAIKMASKLGFNFSGFRDHYFPNQEMALFFSRFTR